MIDGSWSTLVGITAALVGVAAIVTDHHALAGVLVTLGGLYAVYEGWMNYRAGNWP